MPDYGIGWGQKLGSDPMFDALQRRAYQTARGTQAAYSQSMRDDFSRRGAAAPLSAYGQGFQMAANQQSDMMNEVARQRLSFMSDALNYERQRELMKLQRDLGKPTFWEGLMNLVQGGGQLAATYYGAGAGGGAAPVAM